MCEDHYQADMIICMLPYLYRYVDTCIAARLLQPWLMINLHLHIFEYN